MMSWLRRDDWTARCWCEWKQAHETRPGVFPEPRLAIALRLISGRSAFSKRAPERVCPQPRAELALGNIDLRVGAGLSHQTGKTPTIEIVPSRDGSFADGARSDA